MASKSQHTKASMYAEASIVNSVDCFERIIRSGRLERVVEYLGSAGIVDPNNCFCDPKLLPNDFYNYFHENHRASNRVFYEKIPKKIFGDLQKIIETDFLGKLVKYEFGRQLLSHFLVLDPFNADWI